MPQRPPVGSLADDAEAGQLDSVTVQRSLKRVFSFRLVKVRRCLAGDGQGSGGAPGGVINPNAEVEREACLALNFGDRAKFPQGLSAEVEDFPHVRDLRLLGRVDQTALVQEAFDDGTNLGFQEFTGSSGDDEVVRGAHQVDFRVPQDLGALLPTCVETCFATAPPAHRARDSRAVGERITPCGVPASVANQVRPST